MSGVNAIYHQSPAPKDISILPPENLAHIFFFVNQESLPKSVAVCSFWKSVALYVVTEREYHLIQGFTKFLADNLKPSYVAQRATLLHCCEDTSLDTAPNLVQAKQCIFAVREKVLSALTELSDEDLKSLEGVSLKKEVPRFFEQLFKVAQLTKKMDQAIAQANSTSPRLLDEIIFSLVDFENIKKAIELANTSTLEDEMRGKRLWNLAVVLAQKGYPAKAKEVAQMIGTISPSLSGFQSRALIESSTGILEAKGVKEALDFANGLDAKTKMLSLKEMALKIAEQDFDKAIEIANSIVGPCKDDLLCKLATIAIYKDINQAYEITKNVKTITRETREFGITLSKALLWKQDPERALEVLNKIFVFGSDDAVDNLKTQCERLIESRPDGNEIKSRMINAKREEENKRLAKNISSSAHDKHDQLPLFLEIASEVENGDLITAVKLSRELDEPEKRGFILKEICMLLKERDLDLALDIASNYIDHGFFKNYTLELLVHHLLESNQPAKALEISELIHPIDEVLLLKLQKVPR